MEKNWYDFYKSRINSAYQDYFDKKYKPMIDIIHGLDCRIIREEGVGIGSTLKSLKLRNNEYILYGFDICAQMCTLAKQNLSTLPAPNVLVYQDDIINIKRERPYADCIVTHGVLEHFDDDSIRLIMQRYKDCDVPNHIHYVPTDRYVEPSFGDERLLPVGDWLKLTKPKDYILFNDGHDLLLIN